MEIDNELVKKKARLEMGGKMNIMERTAWWYRFERNSQSLRGEAEEAIITEQLPMRIYLNIDRKSLELQKRIALLEMDVNTLKEIKTHATKKSKQYKY